jgi:hypothetical protein
VVLGVLYAYFVALLLKGGHLAWGWFRVPAVSPSFLDLRSITSGWECTRRGVQIVALNPCDPLRRPANYPRLWMWPARLGLGQGSTLLLGLLLALLFLGTVVVFMGRPSTLLDTVVWSAVIVSPALMLGVERGNADLLVFVVVVCALTAFRSQRALVRAGAHALFLVAAILKLFPVFAFATLLRQPRRWLIGGGGLVVALLAIDVAVTFADIRTIERVLPQQIAFSYGSDVAVQATTAWVAAHAGALSFVAHPSTEHAVRWTAVAVVLAGALVVARVWAPPSTHEAASWEVDAFVAGAAVFAGSFVLEDNFDYRLVFLVLAVPALLRWARGSRLAAFALLCLVATLWLGEWVSSASFGEPYPLPYDELANWLLFGCLAGMIVALARRRLVSIAGVMAEGSAADARLSSVVRVEAPPPSPHR